MKRFICSTTSILALAMISALTLSCEEKKGATDSKKDTSAADSTPTQTTSKKNDGHVGRDALASKKDLPTIKPKMIGEPSELSAASKGVAGAATADGALDKILPSQDRDEGTRVTFLDFSANGDLVVGYADGKLAIVDVANKKATMETLSEEGAAVAALSPDLKLAILATSPPKLIKRDGLSDILTFSYLDRIEGVSFSPDSRSMFLASAAGPMRTWKDLDELTSSLEGEVKLQDYVARIQGDFRVDFGPMDRAITSEAGPHIAYTEPNGQIVWWDMNKPTEALYVLRLEPPVQSMTLLGEHLVATGNDGSMRVSHVQERNMLRWSMSERAHLVSGDPARADTFIALHDDHLARHTLANGETTWQIPHAHAARDLCGMVSRADRDAVAVCDGDRVALHAFKDGQSMGTFSRDGDAIVWSD